MASATVYLRKDGIWLSVPFDTRFNELIKQHVPSKHRRWHPKPLKLWWVDYAYKDTAFAIVLGLFEAEFVDETDRSSSESRYQKQEPPKSPPPSSDDPYAVLFLRPNAPQQVIKAAYRALALEYHPDKHRGDKLAEENMKRLNLAYEKLNH